MTIYDLFSKEHYGEPEPIVESNLSLTDLAKRRDDRVGRFTDVTDTLSPLFADPDGRGSRRWREIFVLEGRCREVIAARLSCPKLCDRRLIRDQLDVGDDVDQPDAPAL